VPIRVKHNDKIPSAVLPSPAATNAKKTRRLAVFLPDLIGAGAQRVCLNLANGLVERGIQVDVVVVRAEGSYLEQLSPAINLVNLNASRAVSTFRSLNRYLNQTQPDTMLTALHLNFIALWVKRFSRNKTEVVVSQHINASTYSHGARDLRVRIEPELIRRFYPWADAIVAVSQGVADDLYQISNLTPEQVRVIYNPVIMPDMFVKKEERPTHPWFAPNQPPIILGVGRLDEQKGFDRLIAAFGRIAPATNARLMILGEGALRPNLETQIQRLGLTDRVQLPGFVENPYSYMAHAGLFVLSSLFEGLPTVLVEALFCGVPVVSTDCPNGPDEILAGGRYGHLTPPDDVDALAAAMLGALDGGAIHAPDESWLPYTLDAALDRYADVLGLN